jgi:hypothetical protein
MNWYKIAQLVTKEIEPGIPGPSYLDIGHSYYMDGVKDEENPNYMWIFYEGRILARKESDNRMVHRAAFPFIDFKQGYYMGRYESSTGKVSVSVPDNRTMNELPTVLLACLQKKFPEAVYIYRF